MWCGTCPALFQRVGEPLSEDVDVAHTRLTAGLSTVDDAVLMAYDRVLPASTYTILLLDVEPRLVTPGDDADYFSHEQVSTWGIDPAVGAPEDPGTPYYRTFETSVSREAHLYETVVPMVPPTWNDTDRVASYEADAGVDGATAVAYSLLDVCQPAMVEGEDYYAHWLLTHFLLDGHHKVDAAARKGRPVRLLSLIDEESSIATREDNDLLVAARGRARSPRIAGES